MHGTDLSLLTPLLAVPAAAGLACVGAVINFVRHRPWTRLVFAAISFLSVSGLLALFRAMAA